MELAVQDAFSRSFLSDAKECMLQFYLHKNNEFQENMLPEWSFWSCEEHWELNDDEIDHPELYERNLLLLKATLLAG